MAYQFKASDDELFVIDIENMRWGRASSILSAPSVSAATDGAIARFIYSEEGDLVPMGAGSFSLNGRTEKTTGPGAGLSVVGIMNFLFQGYFVVWLFPNVNVKSDSLTSDAPEEMQKFIKYEIKQPNPEKLNEPIATESK